MGRVSNRRQRLPDSTKSVWTEARWETGSNRPGRAAAGRTQPFIPGCRQRRVLSATAGSFPGRQIHSQELFCGRRIFFRAGARTWCPKADLPSAPVFCPPWMYQVQCTKHWAHPTTLPSVPTTVPTPSSQSSTQAIIIPRPPTHLRVGHLIIKQSTLVPKYRRGWFDCRWWSRRTQQGPDVNIDQLQAIILLSGRTEAQADKNTKDWTNWFLKKGCTAGEPFDRVLWDTSDDFGTLLLLCLDVKDKKDKNEVVMVDIDRVYFMALRQTDCRMQKKVIIYIRPCCGAFGIWPALSHSNSIVVPTITWNNPEQCGKDQELWWKC